MPYARLLWRKADIPAHLYLLPSLFREFWQIPLAIVLMAVAWLTGLSAPWYLLAIALSAILWYRSLYWEWRKDYLAAEAWWLQEASIRHELERKHATPPHKVPTGSGKYVLNIDLDAEPEDIPPFLHLRPAVS